MGLRCLLFGHEYLVANVFSDGIVAHVFYECDRCHRQKGIDTPIVERDGKKIIYLETNCKGWMNR